MRWPGRPGILHHQQASQGDSVPRTGVPASHSRRGGEDDPLSLAAMPTFSCSQHPLLSQREPFLECLLAPAVSSSFWRLVGQGTARHRTTPKAGGSAAGLPEILRGCPYMRLSARSPFSAFLLCSLHFSSDILVPVFSSSVSSPELLSSLRLKAHSGRAPCPSCSPD